MDKQPTQPEQLDQRQDELETAEEQSIFVWREKSKRRNGRIFAWLLATKREQDPEQNEPTVQEVEPINHEANPTDNTERNTHVLAWLLARLRQDRGAGRLPLLEAPTLHRSPTETSDSAEATPVSVPEPKIPPLTSAESLPVTGLGSDDPAHTGFDISGDGGGGGTTGSALDAMSSSPEAKAAALGASYATGHSRGYLDGLLTGGIIVGLWQRRKRKRQKRKLEKQKRELEEKLEKTNLKLKNAETKRANNTDLGPPAIVAKPNLMQKLFKLPDPNAPKPISEVVDHLDATKSLPNQSRPEPESVPGTSLIKLEQSKTSENKVLPYHLRPQLAEDEVLDVAEMQKKVGQYMIDVETVVVAQVKEFVNNVNKVENSNPGSAKFEVAQSNSLSKRGVETGGSGTPQISLQTQKADNQDMPIKKSSLRASGSDPASAHNFASIGIIIAVAALLIIICVYVVTK